MNDTEFDRLCVLSKLRYSDSDKQKTKADMKAIIELMDRIRAVDLVYDDTRDDNAVSFASLRGDVSAPSFSAELLLSNTVPRENCYTIPKLME